MRYHKTGANNAKRDGRNETRELVRASPRSDWGSVKKLVEAIQENVEDKTDITMSDGHEAMGT
jgi:hypothetical protein